MIAQHFETRIFYFRAFEGREGGKDPRDLMVNLYVTQILSTTLSK